jgi:hypothetical protein
MWAIAMQHTQFNVVVAGLLLLGSSAVAGTITGRSDPDPLLDGGPTTPCAAAADFTAGADVNGDPITAADIGARHVPMPDAIAVPLARSGGRGRFGQGGESAYVTLDGRKLEPLVNPKPCR